MSLRIPLITTFDETMRVMRLLASNAEILRKDVAALREEVESIDTGGGSVIPELSDRWNLLDSVAYNSTPSGNTIIGQGISQLPLMTPLKIRYSTETRYGLTTSSGVAGSISVLGPPLLSPIQSIHIGRPELVVQMTLFIGAAWESTTRNRLFDYVEKRALAWNGPRAYLCHYMASKATTNSQTNPPAIINVTIGNQRTSTGNSGLGIIPAQTPAGTSNSINQATYQANFGQIIDVDNTRGSPSTSTDLSISMAFVLE